MTSDSDSVTSITLGSYALLAFISFPEMIQTNRRQTSILHRFAQPPIAIEWLYSLMAASEVKFDLKIEVCNLNYLCYHASLACKGFLEMIHTTTTGQLSISLWIDSERGREVAPATCLWKHLQLPQGVQPDQVQLSQVQLGRTRNLNITDHLGNVFNLNEYDTAEF